MIWYLLFPIRGTTEPPILEPGQALRRAFSRYARYASHHVAATLIISIAVATVLVYPFPFLYTTDFSNGASSLPHHVWTDAEPLDPGSIVEPDVMMRSIWVHGTYMKALETDVLVGALGLQDELLGSTENFDPSTSPGSTDSSSSSSSSSSSGSSSSSSSSGSSSSSSSSSSSTDNMDNTLKSVPITTTTTTTTITTPHLDIPKRNSFHIFNGLTNQSWFFHSPLQYWAGSKDLILADPDVIATINKHRTQPTSVNTTLRHSIIFSGKSYEDRMLVAADALVVTLIYLRDSPVGVQWERKARDLATDPDISSKWDMYPREGYGMQARLYEFQFLPMSTKDRIFLATAYIFIVCYVLWTLSKLRAVKSKAGLIVAILVQIAFSVTSSFTICAILELDLSRVPQAAYPFVMLAMGLEHIFRLINALIATPPDDAISTRIGHAYGETALVSGVSCMQNSLLLLGLSFLVRPPVAAFCIFTAIAIPIDFFFLSTFFLAVLCVDVRRNELGDSLVKESMAKRKFLPRTQKSRGPLEHFLHGNVAFTTRSAGTIVVLVSIMAAQWHFLDFGLMSSSWNIVVNMAKRADRQLQPGSTLLLDIHQARSPISWLRLQDHETAHELIRAVKPHAHSYVALMYDPLVFVLKGADRTPPPTPSITLPPAVLDFLHHQLGSFIATLMVVLVAMRYLIKCLLSDELGSPDGDSHDAGAPLTVSTLKDGHLLDVVRLGATQDGKLVSAGLDRVIRVWDLQSGSGVGSYVVQDPDCPRDPPCPGLGMAADRNSNWIAFVSQNRIDLWNLRKVGWGPSMDIDLKGSKPELISFGSDRDAVLIDPVFVLRKDGVLMEFRVEEGITRTTEICKVPMISAQLLPETMLSGARIPQRIITAAKRGCMHVVTRSTPMWMCENISLIANSQDIDKIVALPTINAFLVSHSDSVELYDINNDRPVYRFDTGHIHRRSLKCLYTPRRHAPTGSPGLAILTLAYINLDTRELALDTYVPVEEGGTVCFLHPASADYASRCEWEQSKLIRRTIRNPGTWATLPCGSVVGVRMKSTDRQYFHSTSGTESIAITTTTATNTYPSAGGLRKRPVLSGIPHGGPPTLKPQNGNRGHVQTYCPNQQSNSNDDWEVWMISHLDGDEVTEDTTPLCPEDDGHLFVSGLGPMINVSKNSVAVGLGNVVKVISIGNARFGDDEEMDLRMDFLARAKRKGRKGGSDYL